MYEDLLVFVGGERGGGGEDVGDTCTVNTSGHFEIS